MLLSSIKKSLHADFLDNLEKSCISLLPDSHCRSLLVYLCSKPAQSVISMFGYLMFKL